jgi:8-amino-7-oxononanoate synthase
VARVDEILKDRMRNNLLRMLVPSSCRKEGMVTISGRDYVDFCSNDYLGLSYHPKLKNASCQVIDTLGIGTCASRLLSGDLEIHHTLEERLAAFKGKESSLVFNSGYQANVGIISALYKKGDVIFSDKLNHASIIDGILLSGAKFIRFFHNDTGHLQSLLKKERGKHKEALIITESIFSMEGDAAPLKEIVALKEKYNCMMMVDEAHATGIFGNNGAGMVEEQGVTESVELIMGTFGKALGSFGAYLACSKKIKDFLINTCRSFIYSTSLPPAIIAANLAGLKVIQDEPQRRKTLLEGAAYFRNCLKKQGFKVRGSSQIVPLILKESSRAITASALLKKRGYWVLPIRPPTVPLKEARLRFSLSFSHDRKILENVVNDLGKIIPV